jgi:hypothetical protein
LFRETFSCSSISRRRRRRNRSSGRKRRMRNRSRGRRRRIGVVAEGGEIGVVAGRGG